MVTPYSLLGMALLDAACFRNPHPGMMAGIVCSDVPNTKGVEFGLVFSMELFAIIGDIFLTGYLFSVK